ncbi:ATP-binding protein [Streptomyces sp. NPDC004610]|uniref:ATP-binding protein n=1 Tax=unclassified Streptomyces TaxID=2593676 RepID=UPI0033B8A6DB
MTTHTAPPQPEHDRLRLVDLPHHAGACGLARDWARRVMREWGTGPEDTEDVLLVMSELVTNSLRHARGPLRAQLGNWEGVIHVRIDDGGPAAQPTTASGPDDEEGRGLVIVAHLAARHGTGTASSPYRAHAWATLAPHAY